MKHEVEMAMEKVRPSIIANGGNVELMGATDLGIVRVNLSGNCFSGRLDRLMTILDIEKTLKKQVPGVVALVEAKDAEAFS